MSGYKIRRMELLTYQCGHLVEIICPAKISMQSPHRPDCMEVFAGILIVAVLEDLFPSRIFKGILKKQLLIILNFEHNKQ